MMRILSREGLVPRVTVFFKPAAQAVLLFGSETWVFTPRMGKALGGGSVPGGDMADGMSLKDDTGL